MNNVTFQQAEKLIEELKLLSPVIEDMLNGIEKAKYQSNNQVETISMKDVRDLVKYSSEIRKNVQAMKYVVSQTKPRENKIFILSILTSFMFGAMTCYILLSGGMF